MPEIAWNRFATNHGLIPLALRGRLGSSFARSIDGTCYRLSTRGLRWQSTLVSRNFRRSVLERTCAGHQPRTMRLLGRRRHLLVEFSSPDTMLMKRPKRSLDSTTV